MKWGGVFFVKIGKWGCFSKKVDLSSTQGALCTVSVFFILHLLIWGVRTHPTHPPPAYRPGILRPYSTPTGEMFQCSSTGLS